MGDFLLFLARICYIYVLAIVLLFFKFLASVRLQLSFNLFNERQQSFFQHSAFMLRFCRGCTRYSSCKILYILSSCWLTNQNPESSVYPEGNSCRMLLILQHSLDSRWNAGGRGGGGKVHTAVNTASALNVRCLSQPEVDKICYTTAFWQDI